MAAEQERVRISNFSLLMSVPSPLLQCASMTVFLKKGFTTSCLTCKCHFLRVWGLFLQLVHNEVLEEGLS